MRQHPDARASRPPAPPSRRWPSSTPNSAAASATTSPPARWPRSASWAPARARPSPSTSRAARRPVYIAENCTQCMECITACPDTALPNMAQDVATVLKTAINNYVTDPAERRKFGAEIAGLEQRARAKMNEAVKAARQGALQGHRPRGGRPPCRPSPNKAEGRVDRDHRHAAARLRQRAGDLPLARAEDARAAAGSSPSSSPTSARAAANASRSAATTTPCA